MAHCKFPNPKKRKTKTIKKFKLSKQNPTKREPYKKGYETVHPTIATIEDKSQTNLNHQGCFFYYDCSLKGLKYYKCSNYRKKIIIKCPSKIRQIQDNSFQLMKNHSILCLDVNNPPNTSKFQKIKEDVSNLLNNKDSSLQSITPNTIMEFLKNKYAPNEVPSYEYIKKMIKQNRNNEESYNTFLNNFETYFQTKDKEIFLRSTQSLLFEEKNKKKFLKIMFFSSNFQINRMALAEHIFVDCTFKIIPYPFKQLLIIMTHDIITNKIIPTGYVLLNSKCLKIYELFFESLKHVLQNHCSNLKLNLENLIKFVTLDFEKALHEAWNLVFPFSKIIGCFFHFKQSLIRRAIKNNLKEDESFEEVLSKICSLCWSSDSNYENMINAMKSKYTPMNDLYDEYFDYIIKQWIPYLQNGILNFINIENKYKTNSALEGYNGRLKTLMKCNVKFDDFFSVLQEEEEHFSKEVYFLERRGEFKESKSRNNEEFSSKKRKLNDGLNNLTNFPLKNFKKISLSKEKNSKIDNNKNIDDNLLKKSIIDKEKKNGNINIKNQNFSNG